MEPSLEVEGDEQLSAFVRHVYRDQLPFTTSVAINRTALRFQDHQREHMREEFTVRSKRFMDRSVKIKPFSSKRSLAAKISIDSPGGREVFEKFETGGTKKPRGQSLTVPREELRVRSGRVRARERLRRLDLKRVGAAPGGLRTKGTGIYKGRRRTFMIRQSGGRGLVFRRVGPGETGTFQGTKLLWVLTPEGEIQPSLEFAKNARHIVDKVFDEEFAKAFDQALRTAQRGPRGGRSRAIRSVTKRTSAFMSALGGL